MAALYLAVGESAPWWFGVAWESNSIVATAVGLSCEEALSRVWQCLPAGAKPEPGGEECAFFVRTVAVLGELERGDETHKRFTLSESFRSSAMRRILTAAARIPLGYVSTYGAIAQAAGSTARAVGRAMATNPLYPIVPCHRVIGADMSLVGYGGRRDREALAAKLRRLEAEAKGFLEPMEVQFLGGTLAVYPVECAIEATRAAREGQQQKAAKAAAIEQAERMQGSLF